MGSITSDLNDHPGPPPRAVRIHCSHDHLRFVWRVFRGKGQTKRYGVQCVECGASGKKGPNGAMFSQWVSAAKCVDYTGFQPHEAVPFADALTDEINAARTAFYQRQNDPEARAARRSAWWDWYDDYLNSGAWRAKRLSVLERDGGLCRTCAAPATEVHHLSYENVGYEPLEDLVSICSACHLAEHSREQAA